MLRCFSPLLMFTTVIIITIIIRKVIIIRYFNDHAFLTSLMKFMLIEHDDIAKVTKSPNNLLMDK